MKYCEKKVGNMKESEFNSQKVSLLFRLERGFEKM